MARKKRLWYNIVTPKVFGNKEIGETVSNDPKKLIGRTVNANAKELTGDYKKSHINIKFEINEIKEDKALTSVKEYNVNRSYINRFIRQGVSKVELVTDLQTNDKKTVRVKCVATINGNKVQAEKKKSVRKILIEELKKLIGNMKLDNLVFIATTNKIQRELKDVVNKKIPLKFVEIKSIKLLKLKNS